MYRYLFASTLIFLSFCAMAQQDPLYSQYQFNQLVVNPAYSGINNNTSIGLMSRIQWSGAGSGPSGAPITNTLTGQTAIAGNRMGLGVMLVQDKLGVANNFEAHASYAYKIVGADKTIAFGLQAGVVSINYDYSALNLKYPDDPEFSGGNLRASKPNFGAGFAMMSDKYFVGLSIPRLLNTEFDENVQSEFRYNRHIYGSFAYLLDISAGIKFKPSTMVRYVEGANISYDLNASFLFNNQFWGGFFTRSFSSIGGMFQADIKDEFKIGYIFEVPIAGLPADFLTHEFMISIDFAAFGDQDVYQRFF